MDVTVSSPPVDKSLQKDDSSLKINKAEVANDEEDEFYDAGEDVSHNSSDTTPLDFSAANEDLPAGTNPTGTNLVRNLQMEDLDDVSSDSANSGNDSPRIHRLLDNNFSEETSQNVPISGTEHNEVSTIRSSCQDKVDKNSTNDEGNSKTVLSPDDCVLNIECSSRSSMEVMEDDSDSRSLESSSVIKVVPDSDVIHENSNVDVVDTSTAVNENVCTYVAPLDSENTEKVESGTSDINEILAAEDSDVDESLQENLDVALKVVEESSFSSPAPASAEKIDTLAKTDDFTNNVDNLQPNQETSRNTKKILEEFREDAAQINGDASEVLDTRFCPCQVVLFRIDFDEYALKHLQKNTESSQSLGDLRTNSNSNSPSTVGKFSPGRCRVLTKAARKMMILPEESFKERQSLRARGRRKPATNSKYAERPRRKTRDTNAQSSKYTYSERNSSGSEDDLPLTSFNKIGKVTANGKKRSARIVKKSSYPAPVLSRKKNVKVKKNFEKELSVEPICQKTLKCVSVPIITDIIESLKDKSCRKLIALVESKASKTIPNRRRKLSRDTSKSLVEDDEYKTCSKMWKYDEGSASEDNNFSLPSNHTSPCKRTPRKSAKARSYVECSESDDDESPSKKSIKRKRNSTRVERNEKKDNDSGESDNPDSRRRNVSSISSKSRTRV